MNLEISFARWLFCLDKKDDRPEKSVVMLNRSNRFLILISLLVTFCAIGMFFIKHG
jgi:hypothetical protein